MLLMGKSHILCRSTLGVLDGGVSDCLVSQACCHGVWSLTMALRMVSSFRMTAVSATFLGFPASSRLRWPRKIGQVAKVYSTV